MIAVAHPGKIGDVLWTLPTVRELSKIHNCKVSFHTDIYCKPVVPLLQCEPCIEEVVIYPNHEKMNFTFQNYIVPIANQEKYKAVYQLGFRRFPDKCLPEFLAETAGLSREVGRNISYVYKSGIPEVLKGKKYVALATRGNNAFSSLFIDFISKCSIPVAIIGNSGEYLGDGIDLTYLDLEQMTAVIAKSLLYIGLMSAPLVIADGFNIKKIIVWDGNEKRWPLLHAYHNEYTNYLVNPSVEKLLEFVKEINI